MLLAGRALGSRLAGLVGIAAAPDFTDWGYSAPTQKRASPRARRCSRTIPTAPSRRRPIPAFWADGQAQRLLGGEIALDCPVRLLHGQDDDDVPPEISLRLARALRSQDVQVTLVKGGDHRLSRDERHRPAAAHRRGADLKARRMILAACSCSSRRTARPQRRRRAPRRSSRPARGVPRAGARPIPTSAIAEASTWLGEASGADASYPQQCLGLAYTLLLRWDAAERAFLAAREAGRRRRPLPPRAARDDGGQRRAGATSAPTPRWSRSTLAATDAAAAGDAGLRAMVEIDRARALVMQGREGEAEADARRGAHARSAEPVRLAALGHAGAPAGQARRGAGLYRDRRRACAELPRDRARGRRHRHARRAREDAAEASWRSVIELAPDSAEAATARGYLAQLAELAGEDRRRNDPAFGPRPRPDPRRRRRSPKRCTRPASSRATAEAGRLQAVLGRRAPRHARASPAARPRSCSRISAMPPRPSASARAGSCCPTTTRS